MVESENSKEPEKVAKSNIVLPPTVRDYLIQYWEITKKVYLTPGQFFSSLVPNEGILPSLKYLMISATASTLVTAVLTFNFFSILSSFIAIVASTFVIAGVALLLCRAMGGKGSFESSFSVFAYASSIQIFMSYAPIHFFLGLYGLVLNYYGLKSVHQLGKIQTITVVFLVGIALTLLNVLMTLKNMFHI